MLGQTILQTSGIPAAVSGIPLFNKTGQTLYTGNVVELDVLQVGTLSAPTTAQLANGGDEANTAFNCAYVPTAAGIAAGAVHAVVSPDYAYPNGIPPLAQFKGIVDGFGVETQINPNLSQIINFGSATAGSVVLSTTSNGTVTSNQTVTYSQTSATLISNLQLAIGSFAAVGQNNVLVTGTGTTGLTATFTGSVSNPGPLAVQVNGLNSATSVITITPNAVAVIPWTALALVAGQTYLTPVVPQSSQQVISPVGTPGVSFALTLTNTRGTSATVTANYSATNTTLASNLQTALQAATGLAQATVTATGNYPQLIVTIPPSWGTPLPFSILNFGGTTGSYIVSSTTSPLGTSGQPFALAMDSIGTPGTYSLVTGNSGAKNNGAPTNAPSNPATASTVNPNSYTTAPQYTLRCAIAGQPQVLVGAGL